MLLVLSVKELINCLCEIPPSTITVNTSINLSLIIVKIKTLTQQSSGIFGLHHWNIETQDGSLIEIGGNAGMLYERRSIRLGKYQYNNRLIYFKTQTFQIYIPIFCSFEISFGFTLTLKTFIYTYKLVLLVTSYS